MPPHHILQIGGRSTWLPPPWRHRAKRSRRARGTLTAVAAAALALTLATGAVAQAAPPNPSSGRGGTLVTVSAPYAAGFTQIAAGNSHTLALDPNGYVLAWGYNGSGRLGDGTTSNRNMPVPVKAPAGVKFTSIASGSNHSLALDSTGKAWAWGYNGNGQVGDGTTTDRPTPVAVSMPPNVTFTQVSAGTRFSLALDSTGKAWTWGSNGFGELGNGTAADVSTPTAVAMPTDVKFFQIAAGSYHSVALTDTGTVYTWGRNASSQLGDGTTTNRATPILVTTGVVFAQVAAGSMSNTSFGLTSTGKAYAWGENGSYQVGDGSTTNRTTPTAVTMPENVTFSAISAGTSSARAIGKQDKKGYGWGKTAIGDGLSVARTIPTAMVIPGTAFTQIDSGNNHGIALGADGRVYGWGANSYGQIGDGTIDARTVPTIATFLATAVSGVLIDGTTATDLTSRGTGRWQVKAPTHAPGKVDVVVNWSYDGVAQTALTFTEGFEYLGPKVTVTTVAYSDATRTTVISKDSVLTPGSTIYWKYTIKNTGKVAAAITAITRNTDVLVTGTVCAATTLAVDATTTCTAQSTV